MQPTDEEFIYIEELIKAYCEHNGEPVTRTEIESSHAYAEHFSGSREQGLYIMSTRGLVDANVDEKGIEYFPGPAALSLVGSLGSRYFLALEERCQWAARTFTSRSTPELMSDFAQRGHLWGAELEAIMLRSA